MSVLIFVLLEFSLEWTYYFNMHPSQRYFRNTGITYSVESTETNTNGDLTKETTH